MDLLAIAHCSPQAAPLPSGKLEEAQYRVG